jgi:ketosteroid isomerase-like protein
MSEENVEVVRQVYARWKRGDFHTKEFFDPGVEHSRVGEDVPGIQGNWRGYAGFAAAMVAYLDALADLRIDAEEVIDLGDDRVLVLSRHRAEGKTSGLPFDHELGDLFTFRDGRIVRFASYWDRADALEAAGLSD